MLLDACADGDEAVARWAGLLVDSWQARYNRSFLQPTAAQITAASSSFARVSGLLSPNARVEIGHIMESLRRR